MLFERHIEPAITLVIRSLFAGIFRGKSTQNIATAHGHSCPDVADFYRDLVAISAWDQRYLYAEPLFR